MTIQSIKEKITEYPNRNNRNWNQNCSFHISITNMAMQTPMTHNVTPKSGWQILAETNLPIADGFESQVQTWMLESLYTLRIAPEVSNRMLKSALEAISRADNLNSNEPYLPLVHLRLYTPFGLSIRSDLKRNWGFFRIDKHGGISPEDDQADHLIELFLYLDS